MGRPGYLRICKFRGFSKGRLIWLLFILFLLISSIIIAVFSGINESRLDHQFKYNYDGIAGLTTIGILTGASFMVFGLFISTPLFFKGAEKGKQVILSLATLIVIFQLLLTLVCFLDLLFPFSIAFCENSSWIRIGLQSFTILFMVISDIHLLFHLIPIALTK